LLASKPSQLSQAKYRTEEFVRFTRHLKLVQVAYNLDLTSANTGRYVSPHLLHRLHWQPVAFASL